MNKNDALAELTKARQALGDLDAAIDALINGLGEDFDLKIAEEFAGDVDTSGLDDWIAGARQVVNELDE